MHSAHKFILFVYRAVAIAALYGLLFGVLAYISVLGFYAVDSAWIVPTSITPTDQNSLAVIDKLVTSRNALSELQADIERQKLSIAGFQSERREMQILEPVLSHALLLKRNQDQELAEALVPLAIQKRADNQATSKIVNANATIEAEIDRDLAAGLMTRNQSLQAKAQLNQQHNGLTDARIEETALRDSLFDKTTVNAMEADALSRLAEIRTKVAGIDIEIAQAEREIAADNAQIRHIDQAMTIAKDTPYFLATLGATDIQLAFVPNDNRKGITVGSPVYACYLNYVACRYAGSVRQVFPNEERFQNPVFKTDMRGFMVQLDLVDSDFARSTTLFVGHKPLGI